MPTFTTIQFDNPINSSLQVGDYIYVATIAHLTTPTSGSGGMSMVVGGTMSEPIYAEKVIEIGANYIKIDKDPAVHPVISINPPENNYILFSKPITINESSLKGYYADITFENYSNTKTELFAISSEAVPSSK